MQSQGAGFGYAGGVRVLGTSLWCDAARARGVCFVSRGDALLGRGRADRLIGTDRTMAVRRALGLPTEDALVPRIGRPFALGRARLELLPSGRLPGAAQLLVELPGWRGLYAGSISPIELAGAEPLQVRACDELVLDAPEAGGLVDGLPALERAVESGAVLSVPDVATLLVVVEHVGAAALRLGARWRKLARLFPSLRAAAGERSRGAPTLVETEPGTRSRGARTSAGRTAVPRTEVRLGTRRSDESDVVALGLLPGGDALLAYAADATARTVHVRLPGRGVLELAGARALMDGLVARGVRVQLLGPPEQLSLFPR